MGGALRRTRRDRARAQLERAAALVPEDKRAKVLGPLFAASDDQLRVAVGVLLLAKTLNDLGWSVEFEPEIAEGTPDPHVSKPDAEYLVELAPISRTQFLGRVGLYGSV